MILPQFEPEIIHHTGKKITEFIINSICDALDWKTKDLRECFMGACFDGQYLHLNVWDHIAEKLQLPLDLMIDSIIHDAAHRLELVVKVAKEGKKNRDKNFIVPEAKWKIELDLVLQHMMKNF